MLFRRRLATELAGGRHRQAASLAWRFLRSPGELLAWLGRLEAVRRDAGLDALADDLALKPWGRCIHLRLRPADRMRIIAQHYREAFSRLGPRFVADALSGRRTILARFAGRTGATYSLDLGRIAHCAREGELTLTLRRDFGAEVASLSFTIGSAEPGGRPDLWIGALQGAAGADAKALTVQVTRDLWGLRPKDLLVCAAQDIAALFAVARIKAISNAAQIVRPARNKRTRLADYDAYWREQGGAAVDAAYFELPLTRPERSASDIKPNKRCAWRARRALLGSVSTELRRALGVEAEAARAT